jgi:protein SCO1/2
MEKTMQLDRQNGRHRLVSRMTRRGLWTVALACVLLGCSQQQKPQFNAIDITGANYATGFELTDHNGNRRALTDFKGKITIVFFGYTHCPDVCPTTLSEVVQVKQLLGDQGSKVQSVFITLDPARDTPEFLKNYVTHFDDSFVGLIPTEQELPEVAKAFKIYYKKVDGPTPTSYTFDHTAGSYVFDAQGRVRLFTHYGTGAKPLAQDIALLLKEQ